MKYLDDLLFWVAERERVRVKKEAGENQPWTNDWVLKQYRFCNVRREDDRVTKWIHNHWLRPNEYDPCLPFAMAVARLVNLPETLQELGYMGQWDPDRFVRVLRNRRERGEKVWTSAYMITGGFSKGGEPKEVIIARVLGTLSRQDLFIHPHQSLEETAESLTSPGIGPFLSAQIVADLKWAYPLKEAKDWWTWCAPGPGSTMGLNFLHDREPSLAANPRQFIAEVNEVRELLSAAGVDICAQNTQNCLCEFSKYVRAKYFGRRLKSAYVPHKG